MDNTETLDIMCEQICELLDGEGYIPMDMRDMTHFLELAGESYDLFAQAIERLRRSGRLEITKKGRLIGAKASGLIRGVFRSTTRGFGFVSPESGGDDIFVSRERSMAAINGDIVSLRVLGHGIEREGEITSILEHSVTELVGSFRELVERPRVQVRSGKNKKKGKLPKPREVVRYFVKPDDPKLGFRVKIPYSMHGDARDGDKVLVSITKYPILADRREDGDAVGKVLRVFGERESRSANYRAILFENGIRTKFDDEVLENAEAVASETITADGRLDLRDRMIFTIDGAEAKDFDDAISIEREGDGWLLGVHIADVSHYVKHNSPLDNEAFERGTSLYFVDKVIPMLPERLSNGVCSLSPDTDKYALSAFIRLDFEGRIIETTLKRTLIRSKLRGVYSEVNDVLENRESSELWEKYSSLFPDTLPEMVRLYEVLSERSRGRGTLELETTEVGFVLDEDGLPTDIVKRSRGISERLIEQFMLCANEGVATWLHSIGMPCVYRIHEEPSPERVQSFALFAHNLRLDIKPLRRRRLTPSCFAEVFAEAEEKGLDGVITVMLLRSLMKAKYSAVSSPHFGLGLELYCHFTSPIRRYPDLAVHRILGAILDGRAENSEQLEAFARAAAERSSENELKALNAEREIEELYKVLYMQNRVGEEFDGIVGSVNSFGMFVELENTCEGLVPISSLDGYFEFDERALTLSCGRVVYSLGTRVRVVLTDCDIPSRRLGFEIID